MNIEQESAARIREHLDEHNSGRPPSPGQRVLAEIRSETGYDPEANYSDEELIDYKNTLEERLCSLLDTLEGEPLSGVDANRALAEIAAGVPLCDEWRSAADFMESVAAVLTERGYPRPRVYADD